MIKTCIKCGFTGSEVQFVKSGNICKACHKACQKAYRQSDKYKACHKAYLKAYRQSDKYKEYHKAYQQSDKNKACQKAYRQSDHDKEYQKAYRKSKIINMSDGYIVNSALKMHMSDAIPELIELKRIQIKIIREIRQTEQK
jgi:hypothetical protein